jgi:hypothetical protein
MEVRFIEIHKGFAKKNARYFSNRTVYVGYLCVTFFQLVIKIEK